MTEFSHRVEGDSGPAWAMGRWDFEIAASYGARQVTAGRPFLQCETAEPDNAVEEWCRQLTATNSDGHWTVLSIKRVTDPTDEAGWHWPLQAGDEPPWASLEEVNE